MILTAFTIFHVILSLIGIVAGLVVLAGMLSSKRMDGWTATFLIFTIATSVTGYMFPVHKLLPSHVVGFLSLVALLFACLGRYRYHLVGGWRPTYVIGSVIALYFNVFVLVVQLFQKVPSLKALAPTQSEPPFKVTQLVVLLLFVVTGFLAAKKFHPA